MSAPEWDVVVAGGGPAASTLAAILLKYRPQTRVAVLEAARFPRFHVGETLVSEVNRILDETGAYAKVAGAGFIPKFGATFRWGEEGLPWTMFFGEMQALRTESGGPHPAQTAHTWHVDRPRYDQILLEHAESLGAHVFQNERAVALLEEGGRVAGLRTASGKEWRGRFVVDATGQGGLASSPGDRELDPRLRNVACWGHFRGFGMEPELTGALDSSRAFIVSHPHGWSWYFPIRPDLASVGVVTTLEFRKQVEARGPERFYREAIASSPELSRLLSKAELVPYEPGQPAVHVIQDFSYVSRCLTRPGFARVGDAAGFVDPILSVGCYLGQFFARLLGYGLVSLLSGAADLPESLVRESYEDHLRDTLHAYREITYFFYSFNRRADAWWAKARSLVEDAGFPKAAADRQAFNVFVTGLAARGSVFREPTAVFDEPFFRDALRQWEGPGLPRPERPRLPPDAVVRLKGRPALRPGAVPLDWQGRMAPALRVEFPASRGPGLLRRIYAPRELEPLFGLVDGRRTLVEVGAALARRLKLPAKDGAQAARLARAALCALIERGLAEADA